MGRKRKRGAGQHALVEKARTANNIQREAEWDRYQELNKIPNENFRQVNIAKQVQRRKIKKLPLAEQLALPKTTKPKGPQS